MLKYSILKKYSLILQARTQTWEVALNQEAMQFVKPNIQVRKNRCNCNYNFVAT